MITKEIANTEIDERSIPEINALKLDELVSGMRIIGAEPISYPATEGFFLYCQDEGQQLHILEIGGFYPVMARFGKFPV